MARKKDGPRRCTVSFIFDRIEPGEVVVVGSRSKEAIRPMSITLNPSDFDKGATFDALIVGGEVAAVSADLANPVQILVPPVEAGVDMDLRLRNEGQVPVWPVAVVVCEVIDEQG